MDETASRAEGDTHTHRPWALSAFHGFSLLPKRKLLGLTLNVAEKTERNTHPHTPKISSDRLGNNIQQSQNHRNGRNVFVSIPLV